MMRAKKGHLLQTENLVRSEKWRQLPVPGDFERLVYCLLAGGVDSWGMMPADPFTLKAELDPVAGTHEPEDYIEAVQILAGVELLQSWSHQGNPWLRVVGHDKIQKDGIRRRSANPAVPIPELAGSSPGVVQELSRSSPGPGVIQSSPNKNSNEVEVEVEGEGKDQPAFVEDQRVGNLTPEMEDIRHLFAELWGMDQADVPPLTHDHLRRFREALTGTKAGNTPAKRIQTAQAAVRGHRVLATKDGSRLGRELRSVFPEAQINGRRASNRLDWNRYMGFARAAVDEKPYTGR